MEYMIDLGDAADQCPIETDNARIETGDERDVPTPVESTRPEQRRELAAVHLRRITTCHFDDQIADAMPGVERRARMERSDGMHDFAGETSDRRHTRIV
jgi:hypothetical protein